MCGTEGTLDLTSETLDLGFSPGPSMSQLGDLGKTRLLSGSRCPLLLETTSLPRQPTPFPGQLRLLHVSARLRGLCLPALYLATATCRAQ